MQKYVKSSLLDQKKNFFFDLDRSLLKNVYGKLRGS